MLEGAISGGFCDEDVWEGEGEYFCGGEHTQDLAAWLCAERCFQIKQC